MKRHGTAPGRRCESATALVAARAERVFDILADITRHPDLDGSGTVLGSPSGPARLFPGAEFTMGMQQHGRQYRSLNRVVEFEKDRRIAWETLGTWRGHHVVGGQQWRWTITPSADGAVVEHAYVWGYARLPLLTVWLPGFPARARHTLARSLDRLTAVVELDCSADAPPIRGCPQPSRPDSSEPGPAIVISGPVGERS